MTTAPVKWISDSAWEICGWRGDVKFLTEGGQKVLELTTLTGPPVWFYDRHYVVEHWYFEVQDLVTDLLNRHWAKHRHFRTIDRAVLSPPEALFMVYVGVRNGWITQDTFDQAVAVGDNVLFRRLGLICLGKQLFLDVFVDARFTLRNFGYLVTKK